MKHYTLLREKKEEMLADLQTAERDMKQRRASTDTMKQQLSLLLVGSPEYKALQEQIDMAELRIAQLVREQRKTFVAREARIYHETHQKIVAEAESIGRTRGLDMVLNFNRSSYDTAKPETVVSHINQPVIWHKGRCDLTDIVFDRLNAAAEAPPEPAANEIPQADAGNTPKPDKEVVEPPLLPADS